MQAIVYIFMDRNAKSIVLMLISNNRQKSIAVYYYSCEWNMQIKSFFSSFYFSLSKC